MITVHLLLFAAYREIVGARARDLAVPEGSTAADLFDRLSTEFPQLEALRPATAFAVNRSVVRPAHVLSAGDEVALLQPVSGGVA